MADDHRIEGDEDSDLQRVHTLKTDASEYLRTKSARIRVAPQASLPGRPAGIPGTAAPVGVASRRRNRLHATLAFIVLATALSVGVVAVREAYESRTERLVRPSVAPSTFLVPDSSIDQPINRLARFLVAPVPLPKGDVQYIRVISDGAPRRVLGTEEFLASIGATPPRDLLGRLRGEFMLLLVGVGTEATSSVPALVFRPTSYTHAVGGLFRWEREMVRGLAPVLALAEREAGDVFEDEDVLNVPVRVTRARNGAAVLLYGVVGQEFIVMTRDETALGLLFRRITLPQFVNL